MHDFLIHQLYHAPSYVRGFAQAFLSLLPGNFSDFSLLFFLRNIFLNIQTRQVYTVSLWLRKQSRIEGLDENSGLATGLHCDPWQVSSPLIASSPSAFKWKW